MRRNSSHLRWTEVLICAALAVTVGAAAQASVAAPTADVPYVGCETDVMGGVAHYAAPAGTVRAIAAAPAVGLRLAFYQAQGPGGSLLPGLYAPRDWHCYAYQGSGIAEFVVAAQPLQAQDSSGGTHPDPGLSLVDIPSDTGAGFSFASQIVAAYFPQRLAAFLQHALSVPGSPATASPSAARTWPADSLQRPDDWSVLITTPPGQQGFGTSGGWFSPGPLPVKSLIVLDPRTFRVRELRVRLSPADASLLPYIQRAERAELRGH
jgi:hypothetical protein